MNDPFTPPSSPRSVTPSPFSDDRQMAMVIYILYLVAFALPVTAIVGLVLAYVNRDGAPEILHSHYTFQIRTFWIGLAGCAVSLPACFLLIGFPMLLAVTVWYIVRCVLGINRLTRGEAYPTPHSWTV